MPEADRYSYDLRELAALLVKEQDIQEGHWGIYVEFGLAAANVPTGPEGPHGKTVTPAAINLVQKMGIQKFAEPNSLTVDAAGSGASTQKATKKMTLKKVGRRASKAGRLK